MTEFYSITQNRLKATWLKRLFVFVVTVGLLAYLVSYIDWYYLTDLLARLSPGVIFSGFALYFALNGFRVLRYRVLLERHDLDLHLFMPIGLYHNFLVRILPFKLGELAYPYLLRRHFHISLDASFSSLFGARLLELLVIILVFIGAFFLSGDILDDQTDVMTLLAVFLIVGGGLGFYFAGWLVRSFAVVLRRLLPSKPTFSSFLTRLDMLAQRLDALHQLRIFAGGVFWSFFTYACSFGVNWILLIAIGLDIPFGVLAVIVSIGMFATAFPFSISGFGMVELGWVLGLTMLADFTMPEATAIGFMLNGFQVLAATLWGGIGYALLRYFTRGVALDNNQRG